MKKLISTILAAFFALSLPVACSTECKHANMTVERLKEPTCTEHGNIVYVCSDCGYRKQESPILPHDTREVTVQPTCYQAGERAIACRNCEYRVQIEVLQPRQHEFRTEAINPTCYRDGYERKYCALCDKTEYYTPIDKIPHAYLYLDRQIKCLNCNTVLRTDCEHLFTEVETVLPSENEDGYTKIVCDKCGVECVKDIIPRK